MNAVVTMGNGNAFHAYRVYANGTAKMDGIELIQDFAAHFIEMCEAGWRMLTQLEIDVPQHSARKGNAAARKGNESRKGMLRQYDGFRTEWAEYVDEFIEMGNLDRG